MKRLALVVALCCLILAPSSALAGDTGTYRIAEYGVKLTPRSDGKVEIEYHQKWEVTGGHIPWITVGTPNENFEIVQGKTRGAIKSIKPANESGWSGVRIDLDRDYKPGESFDVWFAIVQRQLFYADKDNYKLDFTPGWYDRAKTGILRLEVFFFAKLDIVKAEPKPAKVEGQSMFWEKPNLKEGEKFSISISFPKKVFPKEIDKGELKSEGLPGWGIALIILGVAVFVIIFFIASGVFGEMGGGGYSRGGGIFYGGGGGGILSGGGGGGGGRSVSCDCACVSCACACACVGGGGAGCDRKLTRRCPLCRNCERRQNCRLWNGGAA